MQSKRLTEWLLLKIKYVEKMLPEVRLDWKSPSAAAFLYPIQSTADPEASALLKLQICPRAPEAMPSLIVLEPVVLPKRPSGTINSWGGSTTFHTSPLTECGRVTICHTPLNQWSLKKTYLQVLQKGRIWWEAYQLHLHDGKSIDDHFKNNGISAK